MYAEIINTNGTRWYMDVGNKCQLYEINEAFKVVEEFNAHNESKIHYSEGNDSFWMAESGEKEFTIWQGKNYETKEGIKHLYSLGRK